VSKVPQKDLQAIHEILEMISEAELAMGEFYRACARVTRDDHDLWTILEEEEKKHHAMVRRISEMVSERPDHFRLGKPFSENALRTFVGWLRERTKRMSVGEVPAKAPLHVARDVEQSLIELRFCEAVQSDDVDFNELLNRIREETFFHRERISRRIKEKAYSAIILAR
jgi:rubrerythrin